MLMDLFSIFDYQAFLVSKNIKHVSMFWWVSLSLPSLALLSSGTWVRGSTLGCFLTRPLLLWAWNETRLKVSDLGGSLLIVSACSWVTITVLWQATPGVFVSISHLSVTGCIALPYWSAMVLASALSCSNDLLSSLVPVGCPDYLIPALVVVEFFSHLMRPLALCARLSLTTMTGHIILGLVWGLTTESIFMLDPENLKMITEDLCLTPELDLLKVVLLTSVNAFLILVELGISLLQAYIFFTLVLFFNTQYPRA